MSIFNNKFKSSDIYGALNVVDYAGILGVGAVPASFDISGDGVFRGNSVSFTTLPTCSQTPTTGTQLITKTYADATYTGSGILSSANAWTNTNSFNSYLPTSTLTPTTGSQLITKAFADATYIGSDVKITNNIWTGTNAFNSYLPTSTITPTTSTQLITKAFADATYIGSDVKITNNIWTGTNSFNSYLPTSTITPTTSTQLITKTYADTALNLKANLASPTFTGTVGGIDKTMVGLANVDNTSDANKPVSTATTTALNLKANLASPTFTGTPLAPTATLGTNTTQLATTAFVLENGASFTPITATFTFYTP